MSSSIFLTQSEASHLSWIRFQENREREWGLLGHDWGIHDLNRITGGIIPRKITTIAGLPSHGKTALINPIINGLDRWKAIGKTAKPELLVATWEMEASELTDRLVMARAGIDSKKYFLGAKLLSKEELNRIETAFNEVSKISIKYQQQSLNIDDFISCIYEFWDDCKKLEKEDGIKRSPVIIIDYIGLAELDSSGIRTTGINDFYRKVKQAMNIIEGHCIIFAQLDKSARDKEMPDLNHLAESQNIERNSDNLVLIFRPEHLGRTLMPDFEGGTIDARGKMMFRTVKCRGFGTGDFIVNCDISKNHFWPLYLDNEYPYWELYSKKEFWLKEFSV
jgi:replicative DNA helicase